MPEHTFTFRVRYAETDQMGTYYNGRALEWFEVGRSEFSRALGLPYTEWERRGVFTPLVEAFVKFQGRARYDDELEMTVSAVRVGHVRVRFRNRVVHLHSRQPVCEGYTLHALTNAEGKPQRIPEWIGEHLPQEER